jgi:hypothetical protein
MRKTLTTFLIATLCLLCYAVVGWAIYIGLNRERLITTSRDIVYGQVTDVHCEWAENREDIYTFAKIRIIEQFKGEPLGKEITMQTIGGEIGRYGMDTGDSPKFQKDTFVIVHTYLPADTLKNPCFILKAGCYWVRGGNLGLLLVEKDKIPRYDMTLAEYRELVRQLTK